MAGGLFIQVSVGGKICDNLGKLTRKLRRSLELEKQTRISRGTTTNVSVLGEHRKRVDFYA